MLDSVPAARGHVSGCVEPNADPVAFAARVPEHLSE